MGTTFAGAVVFEPASVLPAQLMAEPKTAMQPERRLVLAVLADAIATLERSCRPAGFHERGAEAETRRWMLSDDARWPFSFVNVCAVLGIDHRYLRRGLKQMLERESGSSRKIRARIRRIGGSRTRVTPVLTVAREPARPRTGTAAGMA
jgi:hypothetical protein